MPVTNSHPPRKDLSMTDALNKALLVETDANKAGLAGEVYFRAMSDASPLGIFVSDKEGSCVYTNAAYQKISGLSFEQTLGTNWSLAIHPEERQRVLEEWLLAARERVPFHSEFRFLQQDGSIVWMRVSSAVMQTGNNLLGLVQTVEDISERKITEFALQVVEEALFEEKERAQVTLNSIGDAVLTTDMQGNVTYLNRMAEILTAWPRAEALGHPLAEVFNLVDGTTHQRAPNPALRAIAENMTVGLAANCVLISRDGIEVAVEDSAAPIHNRLGQAIGAVIVFHDASQSRAMTLRMSHLAQHDVLTGLPNRLLLAERLSRAIGLAQRNNKRGALMFLDLDHFKNINDSLGHSVGDQLLQMVGERLVACVRATDTVCRQGGDEFVILLPEIDQPQDAAQVAEKLLASVMAPMAIDGQELHMTLSIGICLFPDNGFGADIVMQNADFTMYHAKLNGHNHYQFFNNNMNTLAAQRLLVENGLRRALKQDEFFLQYRPQVDIASGLITGAEALIRWQDPDLGLVGPEQFVPVAEECGLIVQIGHWVLRTVCMQVKAWQDAGLHTVPIAVNISAVEFKQKDFLAGVALILKEAGLAPRYLKLELTETIIMHAAETSVLVLEALKAIGVQLAIDDFGTGYSSLSYLKRFPIDTLKIDQSFVRDIQAGNGDAAIVSAVISMGRSLNQRVIAEGVETQEQLAFLRLQHCDEAQGFLFSHPLSAECIARLLVNPGQQLMPLASV